MFILSLKIKIKTQMHRRLWLFARRGGAGALAASVLVGAHDRHLGATPVARPATTHAMIAGCDGANGAEHATKEPSDDATQAAKAAHERTDAPADAPPPLTASAHDEVSTPKVNDLFFALLLLLF